MTFPAQATAVCKKVITQITLKGWGLLSLAPECVFKHKFTSIQGQQIISSSVTASYTSLLKITDTLHSEQLKPLLNEIHTSKYISQIENLTAIQTILAQQEILELPNKSQVQNYHHTAVGYLALILIVIILVLMRFNRAPNTVLNTNSSPTPAPCTSEFTVHI